MNEDIDDAIKALQLGSVFSEYELLQNFKLMVQESPKNITELSKSIMILLKSKAQSLSDLNLSSRHDKLFKRMILDATFSEKENQVHLKLCEFDSLTHHMFYNAIKKVFKIKGSREIKTKFSLTLPCVIIETS